MNINIIFLLIIKKTSYPKIFYIMLKIKIKVLARCDQSSKYRHHFSWKTIAMPSLVNDVECLQICQSTD